MITVTILTKNSAETVRKTLESVRSFDEVIVLDSGSEDATVAIAQSFANVTVHRRPFCGFGPMHNSASELSSNDWILSVDSDEALTQELVQEISTLKLNPECVYAILRHNFYNGKQILWCGGWHPDWVVRLYNRKKSSFCNAKVHEKILTDGLSIHRLKYPLVHTPYRSISDFLYKMQHYSTLFAEERSAHKSSSVLNALLHSWGAFFKSYILKRGFLGGREGFIISLYNGHTTFYKYLKLWETSNK